MRWLGMACNIGIRIAIVYFLAEAWILQDDPRFLDKAIAPRNTVIVGAMSLLFPAIWFFGRKAWKKYPWRLDTVYLSLYALDMAGNSFNLYNSYEHFDLIPHFHGTGVGALVLAVYWAKTKHFTSERVRVNLAKLAESSRIYKSRLFWESVIVATGLATLAHVILEAQEYYTDVWASTINVRGVSDTINDLAVGVLGSFLYALMGLRLFLKRNGY